MLATDAALLVAVGPGGLVRDKFNFRQDIRARFDDG